MRFSDPAVTNKILSSPRLRAGGIPRSIPDDKFLWHNHVQHSVGMGHGWNGFRYRRGEKPVDYRLFMRCHCGVVDLPHYSIRTFGKQKCVSPERILMNSGMTAKQARAATKGDRQ